VLEADEAADIQEVQAWAAGAAGVARPDRRTYARVEPRRAGAGLPAGCGVFLTYASPKGGEDRLGAGTCPSVGPSTPRDAGRRGCLSRRSSHQAQACPGDAGACPGRRCHGNLGDRR
jgi:hypothetical protein